MSLSPREWSLHLTFCSLGSPAVDYLLIICPVKTGTLHPLSPKVLFWNSWRNKIKGHLAKPCSALNGRMHMFVVVSGFFQVENTISFFHAHIFGHLPFVILRLVLCSRHGSDFCVPSFARNVQLMANRHCGRKGEEWTLHPVTAIVLLVVLLVVGTCTSSDSMMCKCKGQP